MKRSAPLRRSRPLRRLSRLRPVSARRRSVNRKRSLFVAQVLRERPRCEVDELVFVRDARLTEDGRSFACETHTARVRCRADSAHVHEKLTRARGGDILDEDNVMAVCPRHHRIIHDEPAWATSMGYLVPSWEAR